MDEVFSYELKRLVPPDEASFEDFKLTVVSDASEDWLGVYEVWWQANGWYPGRPVGERLTLAENAVLDLLSEGLVEMYRGESWEGEKSVVPADERDAVLRAWETWTVPDGPRAFLSATAAGKARVTKSS